MIFPHGLFKLRIAALIPGVICAVLMLARTALEDKALQAELLGYPAYTQRTRYRLLPGVW